MKTKILIVFFFFIQIAVAEPFTVGVSIPMTGDLHEYGKAVQNGFLMAKNDLNGISVAYEDNQYSSAKGVLAFERLKANHKANIIYQWGENVLSATASLIDRDRIPTLAMSVDARSATGKKYIIRTINSHFDFAKEILSYLRSQKVKNIGILSIEDQFIASIVEGINKQLAQGEKTTLLGTLSDTESNFNSIITGLRNKNFDSIGIMLNPGQSSTFFRQAKALNVPIQAFGTDTFDSETVINDAKGGMEGATFPIIPVPDDFKIQYLNRFGNDIQIAYAYNAYLMAELIAEKFSNLKDDLSADQIMAKLKDVNGHPYIYKESTSEGAFYKFPMITKRVTGKTTTVVKVNGDRSL